MDRVHERIFKTPPAAEPVTWAELQSQLRIDADDEETFGESLIVNARKYVEDLADAQLMPAVSYAYWDRFPTGSGNIVLPYAPVRTLDEITYTDSAGDPQTLADTVWSVDINRNPPIVYLDWNQVWPTVRGDVNGVRVEYSNGFADAASVDGRLKQAILLLAGHWFMFRSGVLTGTISKEIEFGVHQLVDNYVVSLAA